jgi:hypothetical protein
LLATAGSRDAAVGAGNCDRRRAYR